MPFNNCHTAVVKRGKRDKLPCKEDATKGFVEVEYAENSDTGRWFPAGCGA